ncbi:Enoyl-[acyl-carrier-protein] reductase [NADH] [Actinomadura rubteroloni]|uniref:Enoyl-[acyl-carrier-protein] reductase [NADH] n=1 Tax=Actinomadura rubteroloni TaxID=1926885 RepID=A0A2P4UET6_9ACTN|nr:enoyl-ACP reductase FabI [Actinomadura rubteroloni]POM23577.1 Enoyl-[acyl-carrier-protein] reductase [NADH] [Actinomadura rubteroloni]
MGLLDGKNILITGVISTSSLAFHTARLAQAEGARIVLTGYGRMSLVELVARTLPHPAPVVELDVTDADELAALPQRVREHVDHLDGVLHAIAYAPPAGLGGDILRTEWEDAAHALHVSAFSLKSLTQSVLSLLRPGAGVVALDFDASTAWPGYNWQGIAKSTLESCARYLARDLGPREIRVNLVACGPVRTVAASAVDFTALADSFARRAPLGWGGHDHHAVARACVALLSPWFPATTGEIVHVDGGAHAIGA